MIVCKLGHDRNELSVCILPIRAMERVVRLGQDWRGSREDMSFVEVRSRNSRSGEEVRVWMEERCCE